MPINTTGKSNPKDYLVGRGKVYFTDTLLAGDTPDGYRFLGNAPGLALNSETEEVEHFSSQSGLRVKDASAIVSQSTSFSLILDEINHNNFAIFLTGETATPANSSVTGVVLFERTVKKGIWYDIYDQAALPITDGQSNRLYDLGAVTVKNDGAVVTYVVDDDYVIDPIWGRIFIVPTGAIADDQIIEIAVAGKAGGVATIDVVKALTKTSIEGALKFIGVNPVNGGKEREVQIHRCKLRANGELPLITEGDFTQIPLLGSIDRSLLADADSNYITITDHDNS